MVQPVGVCSLSLSPQLPYLTRLVALLTLLRMNRLPGHVSVYARNPCAGFGTYHLLWRKFEIGVRRDDDAVAGSHA